jgi:alpha-L-fucosidase 2
MRHVTSSVRTAIALALGLIQPVVAFAQSQPLVLGYNKPAAEWVEALPVGSGRMGGMIFGGLDREHIQFNEDTLWMGEPHDYSRPGAVEHLAAIQRMVLDGWQTEDGERRVHGYIVQNFLSDPLRQMPYQPFGDLYLQFDGHEGATNYARKLDIGQALATVEYKVGDTTYKREIFSSAPHRTLVVRLTADKPGSISFKGSYGCEHENSSVSALGANRLVLSGRLPSEYRRRNWIHRFENPLSFEAQLRVVNEGGTATVGDEGVEVANADAVTLMLVAATSFIDWQNVTGDPHGLCENDMELLQGISYDDLKASHIADYQRLFNRVSIDLGESDDAIRALPTDQRISRFAEQNDPELAALYYQFGRYLLIGSSRPGSQPANLQGIWNYQVEPPWEGKYTVNINFEMNYWPAEQTNLAECAEPMFDLIEETAISGRRTAKNHYGARGWIVHHNTDHWRATAGINNAADGIYIVAGAWLCQHLWWHYEYSGDTVFLSERAYPIMREAALFYLDHLIEDPRPGGQYLITVPSNSPEHGGLCAAPAMDNQILRYFFSSVVKASEILGIDSDLRAQIKQTIDRLPPDKIGRFGQLQEWMDDKDVEGDRHRHVSHLWALFPGEEISRHTPELFDAARVVLVNRGDAGTGWSRAWKVNFWARMLDGDHAYKIFEGLIDGSTYPNMFDKHAPFQIDGNFGGTSGVTQMLMQSHSGEIALLPALPSRWPTGSVSGLRARGGVTVDVAWTGGKAATATLKTTLDRPLRLRAPEGQRIAAAEADGAPIALTTNDDGTVSLPALPGRTYKVTFAAI